MPFDPNLLQAARLLAKLSLDELAERSQVSRRSLLNLEAGNPDCLLSTLEILKQVLEEEGVIFLGETESHGPGVRVSRETGLDWTRKRADQRRSRMNQAEPET
ncbi:helix-turn-helix domain-containing protein [Aureimonas ureilytica]|uniref:helix-turn-helix domain-containing protein n=1 Tax=Aureimonas ureilytica TaxID=401562 RepID=UPI0003701C5A|nr:helix-turn-helix transcriptional regulator [Aureimonas ureilytica]